MDEIIKLVIAFEVVAEVENLKTLRTEYLLRVVYPWGSAYLIVEETEQ